MHEPKVIIWDTEFFHINWGADLGFLLCMGWKEFGSKKVHLESISKFNDGTWMDDGPLAERCGEILREADMWVTYNGIKCDVPFLQTRLLLNRKPLLPPVAHKDLIYTVRHKLKLSRNSLLAVQDALELDEKKTPVKLMQWLKTVVKRDKKALEEIEHHCKQDVLVLERVYEEVRPLLLSHPRLFGYEPCNKCGGDLLKNKIYFTSSKLPKITLKCKACGGYETRSLSAKEWQQLNSTTPQFSTLKGT